MLVLSRKQGETIRLITPGGEEIHLLIHRIAGGTVRISFNAPESIRILRGELDVESD